MKMGKTFTEALGEVVCASLVGFSLRGDAEGAAEHVEVVDVGRAEIGAHRAEDLRRFDAEHQGFLAIDFSREPVPHTDSFDLVLDLRQQPGFLRHAPPQGYFHLPPEQVHCIENTGPGVMRILGVFHPSGDPASRAYEDDSEPPSAP